MALYIPEIIGLGLFSTGVIGAFYALYRTRKDAKEVNRQEILENQEKEATNQYKNVPYTTIDTHLKK